MPKNPAQPALSIVSPETTGGPPPRELGQHGRKLWDEVQAAYGITDRGGVELLAQACQAADRAEALAEAIARDGSVVYSRSGVPRAIRRSKTSWPTAPSLSGRWSDSA